jgi:3-phytase
MRQVQATVETEPVPSPGDAADDAAIWIHPADPSLSLIIGTDKDSGLAAYDLAGAQVQFLADGELNNVDVRYDFPLGGALVDIVAAGNRTDDTIAVYAVDPTTRVLRNVTAGPLPVGLTEAYGFCLYRSGVDDALYAFVNDKEGDVEQWRLQDDGKGRVEAVLVRRFSVGTQTEGMVADDELGRLYVGEEDVGIWRYGAEPDAGSQRFQVDSTDEPGHLVADVEGLAIYHARRGTGYLLASSQGASRFTVYERQGNNKYVMTFEVVGGQEIDGVSGTDGIAVSNAALGARFPQGVFVAQDEDNTAENQNYKLVPWDAIADGGSPRLDIDTSWDPRGLAQRRRR